MEAEGLIVSSAIKFPVRRQVRKASREEYQTHGYEVDLVGANAHQLVLATVKSFFGSRGVVADEVRGDGPNAGAYRLLNDPVIRDGVLAEAAKRFHYLPEQISIRLYVGKFAGTKTGAHEKAIRKWCAAQPVPIQVYGLPEVVAKVREAATSKTYRDNPVLVTMKVLNQAGLLVDTDTSGIED